MCFTPPHTVTRITCLKADRFQCSLHAYKQHSLDAINITLTPEFERRIAEKLNTGLYSSASEVIRDYF